MKKAVPLPKRTGRPRDPEADRKLLTTALQLIKDEGYAGFNIDEIARRTSISKATIYRRWPSSGELLLDALLQYGAEQIPLPNTGRLDRDLHTYFRVVFTGLQSGMADVLRSLAAEAQVEERFRASFQEKFITARRAPVLEILRAGQARGELSRSVNLDLLLDFIFGAMWYRLLILGPAPDEKLAAGIVELVRRYR